MFPVQISATGIATRQHTQDGIGRYAGWAAGFRSAQISRLYGVIRGADLDKTGIGADDPVGPTCRQNTDRLASFSWSFRRMTTSSRP